MIKHLLLALLTSVLALASANGETAAEFCKAQDKGQLAQAASTAVSRADFLRRLKSEVVRNVDEKIQSDEHQIKCLKGQNLKPDEIESCEKTVTETMRDMENAVRLLKTVALLSQHSPSWANTLYLQRQLALSDLLDENENTYDGYFDHTFHLASAQGYSFNSMTTQDPEVKKIAQVYRNIFFTKINQYTGVNFCRSTRPGFIDNQIREEATALFKIIAYAYPILKKLKSEDFSHANLSRERLAEAFAQQILDHKKLAVLIHEMNVNFENGSVFKSTGETASRMNWTTNDYSMALLEYSQAIDKIFLQYQKPHDRRQACNDWENLSKMKASRELWSVAGGATVGLTCLGSVAAVSYTVLIHPLLLPVAVGITCTLSILEGSNGLQSANGDYYRAELEAAAKVKTKEEVTSAVWDSNISAWTNGAGVALTFTGFGTLFKVAKFGKLALVGRTALPLEIGKSLTDPATSVIEFLERGRGTDAGTADSELLQRQQHEQLKTEIQSKLQSCNRK